ncbi:MAG: hypothetical protein R6W70_01470 [bacterium]
MSKIYTVFIIVLYALCMLSSENIEEKEDGSKKIEKIEKEKNSAEKSEESVEEDLEKMEKKMRQKPDSDIVKRSDKAHSEMKENEKLESENKKNNEKADKKQKNPETAKRSAPKTSETYQSEQNSQIGALFSDDSSELGFFFDVQLKLSGYDTEASGLLGARAGFVFNLSQYPGAFLLGAGIYGNLNRIHEKELRDVPESVEEDRRLHLGYGGMIFEYHFFPHNMFNFSAGILTGFGGYGFSVIDKDCYEDRKDDDCEEKGSGTDLFYVIEPEIKGYVNLTDWFRMGTGVSYRFFGKVNMPGMSNRKMSCFTGSLIFSFGAF